MTSPKDLHCRRYSDLFGKVDCVYPLIVTYSGQISPVRNMNLHVVFAYLSDHIKVCGDAEMDRFISTNAIPLQHLSIVTKREEWGLVILPHTESGNSLTGLTFLQLLAYGSL